MTRSKFGMLIPIMLAFFVMGYVDLVGVATNYIKVDFGLSDTTSNLLSSMVFIWFLVLSVPASMLMNRIGRRKTVIASLLFTLLAMLTPLFGYNFYVMLVSFALLGIGNTFMQVSLNPLVTNVVTGEKLASTLTFGQFIKAIASFLAPIIAGWASIRFGNWRLLFPIFAAVSLVPIVWLSFTRIHENREPHPSSLKGTFSLLADRGILLLFIGILAHVAIDVGMNLTSPKILMERIGMVREDAGYATVLYFISRTAGTFLGAFILSKVAARKFFIFSLAVLLIGVAGLFFANTTPLIYSCVALLGAGNSNMFSIIFSRAMLLMPSRNNEISGLMITGVSGGVLSLLMGVASDAVGSQNGAVAIIALCVLYLGFLSFKIK